MANIELGNHTQLVRPGPRGLARLDNAALMQRRRDELQTALTAGRMSDVSRVTRFALDEAAGIGAHAEAAVRRSPAFSKELEEIAVTGINGIRDHLTAMTNSWSR
jgi:hypothetical protein